jgi:hypothetical protein
MLHVRVSTDFYDRVARAAKAAGEQALASWVRLAIIEKLDRDARDHS